jgi:hypothetical protein
MGLAMTEHDDPVQPKFGNWMGSLWLFTILRYGLFLVLWAVLYFLGVKGMHGLLAPLIALVLSVPLSFVLLSKPRARLTRQMELRVEARKAQRESLDTELDPNAGRDEP